METPNNKEEIIQKRIMEESNNIDRLLIGYDQETQQKIRELYRLDKGSLVLHILNIEEHLNKFINQLNK
jgi:hypothetical protein